MIGVLLLVSQVPREAGMIDGQCGAPSFFLSAFCSSTGTAFDKRARPPYEISSMRTVSYGRR
jgi:hypothetical protein